MANPIRGLARQFLRHSPAAVLFAGVVVALVDFAILYAAATADGVLRISGGIGLLQNYGLWSTVVGNPLLLYVARKYYEVVSSFSSSRAIVRPNTIQHALG